MDRAPLQPQSPARRGSGLFLAMIMLAAVAGLMALSSDNVQGVYILQQQRGHDMVCTAAAEAVCSAKEQLLLDLSAEGDHVALTTFRIDGTTHRNYGQQWFGNCLVKWRIEPALIEEPVPTSQAAPAFVSNPDPDTAAPTEIGQQSNDNYYHYRIATEAVYDVGDGQILARAQAFRWVQINRQSLFKYALFYAQEGREGDLEMCHGPDFNVRGGVHSNGAIYIGGADPTTVKANINNGGATRLGPVLNPDGTVRKKITVTGVDGLFRQRKATNVFFEGGAGYPGGATSSPDPRLITDTTLHMTQNNRSINGVNLQPSRDSRSAAWNTTSLADFGGFVRTRATGATVVKSLSNIAELAGRPFEPVRLIDAATEAGRLPRYWNPATYNAANSEFTAELAPGHPTVFPAYPVNGTYLNYAIGTKDTSGNGFTTRWSNRYQLHHLRATGGSSATPVTAGLIIRERPAQDTSIYPNGANLVDGTAIPVGEAGRPVAANYASANYAGRNYHDDRRDYMRSQYQVFMGATDITNDVDMPGPNPRGFFDYAPAALAPYATGNVPPAEEHSILNRRLYWAQNVYPNKATYASNARQSLLTLNMDVIQRFLGEARSRNFHSGFSSAELAKERFNGLIYVDRYNRLDLPTEQFTAAVRIARARKIDWQHDYGNGVNDPLGTSRLTIVTPNPAFLWGNFNSDAVEGNITPVALMADMVTVLSEQWVDSASNLDSHPGMSDASTTYNVALVLNNYPMGFDNRADDASAHTFVWWMENWGGRNFNYKGSVVVLNGRRYARGYNQGANRSYGFKPTAESFPAPPLYGAPTRNINFNEDLTTRSGTPPFTPFGVNITRQANYVVSLGRY